MVHIRSHVPEERNCFHNLLWRSVCLFRLKEKLEKAMAPHSSTPAWKIPWTEEPGRLQSMGSLGVGYDWATSLSIFTFHFHALEKEMATHSSVLAWRIPGMGEPGGLPFMGSHRVGHDWSDFAAAAARKNSDASSNKLLFRINVQWGSSSEHLRTKKNSINRKRKHKHDASH